jgi:hypothetical protein
MNNIALFIPMYYDQSDLIECLNKLLKTNISKCNLYIYLINRGCRKSVLDNIVVPFIESYHSGFKHISIEETDFLYLSDNINIILDNLVDIDYISVVEPKYIPYDENWLQILIDIYDKYDHRRLLGGLSIDTSDHNIKGDIIKWQVEQYTINRSISGDGFINSVFFTEKYVYDKIGGLFGNDYINNYALKSFSKGYIVTYIEGLY